MRLWILSDLHLEVDPDIDLAIPDADVAVVAGDVHRPAWKTVQWLAGTIAPHMPVVCVLGNHEFYAGSVEGCTKRALAAAASVQGVHLLHDSAVVIGGICFVGGTLWTDYAIGTTSHRGRQRDIDIAHAMHTCGSLMPDHTAIHVDDSMRERWEPSHARSAFRRTRQAIERVLSNSADLPAVVVTHHAPHPESVEERYRGNPMTPGFASDLSDLIWGWQPRLWIHGHVHHTTEYPLGSTVVVANPRGCPGENPGFKPDLMLTVSGR